MPMPLILCIALSFCPFLRADEGAAIPSLSKAVSALGFPALERPLKLYDGQPPAMSKKGMPVVADLKLKYGPDEPRPLPDQLTLDLSAREAAVALDWISQWTDGKAEVSKLRDALADDGSRYQIRFTGLAVLKLADLQFVKPLEGEKKRIEEYQLAVSALIARKTTIQMTRAGQAPVSVESPVGVALGAEYQQMETKVWKEKVTLDEKQPIVRLGRKPKDPRYKRVTIAFPRPESGEDPSMIMVTVDRLQLPCEVVLDERPRTVREQRSPEGWVFRGQGGVSAPELVLPSQFDGKAALGVFLRILDHEKKAFHPRTRELKLEVILANVKMKNG